MGYYILITIVINILVRVIISKTRPSEKGSSIPYPYSISPSFLAWLRGRATVVIQLAMFRLLRKNFVTIIHCAENIELCANQQYAECEMTRVEKILFDHFSTPKPSAQNLPLSLYVADKNHWSDDPHCRGLMLSPAQRTWNMILITVPSFILIVTYVWKAFFDHHTYIHSGVFSWLTMLIFTGLWLLIWVIGTLNVTRLDREGISINILSSYIDKLKDTLIADAETTTDDTADYYVAIGKTNLLPERYREYVKIIKQVNYPGSVEKLD
ncbi:TIGR04222 domain-containing membrane protein [Klebsiella aerogenes]|uniref:TIGR04222 domain-containing membrane protein n=1 Tax=Klebsiella aerogenes TaxID=548 RepID=UPI0036B24510